MPIFTEYLISLVCYYVTATLFKLNQYSRRKFRNVGLSSGVYCNEVPIDSDADLTGEKGAQLQFSGGGLKI